MPAEKKKPGSRTDTPFKRVGFFTDNPCRFDYTWYDIYWPTIGIGSDDTGSSSYGVINISNTVYTMPTLDVDWSWMSYNLGTSDYGTYQATKGW